MKPSTNSRAGNRARNRALRPLSDDAIAALAETLSETGAYRLVGGMTRDRLAAELPRIAAKLRLVYNATVGTFDDADGDPAALVHIDTVNELVHVDWFDDDRPTMVSPPLSDIVLGRVIDRMRSECEFEPGLNLDRLADSMPRIAELLDADLEPSEARLPGLAGWLLLDGAGPLATVVLGDSKVHVAWRAAR